MEIKVVPPGFVAQTWGVVGPLLAAGTEYACGDFETEHVRVYITTGQWMLMVAEDETGIVGAAAVEFENRAKKRVALVVTAGGKGIITRETLARVKSICKEFGATHIEACARESARRLFKQAGFTDKCSVVEMGVE